MPRRIPDAVPWVGLLVLVLMAGEALRRLVAAVWAWLAGMG